MRTPFLCAVIRVCKQFASMVFRVRRVIFRTLGVFPPNPYICIQIVFIGLVSFMFLDYSSFLGSCSFQLPFWSFSAVLLYLPLDICLASNSKYSIDNLLSLRARLFHLGRACFLCVTQRGEMREVRRGIFLVLNNSAIRFFLLVLFRNFRAQESPAERAGLSMFGRRGYLSATTTPQASSRSSKVGIRQP